MEIESQFLEIVENNPDIVFHALSESEILNTIILADFVSKKYTLQQIAIRRKVTFRKVRVVVDKYKKSKLT